MSTTTDVIIHMDGKLFSALEQYRRHRAGAEMNEPTAPEDDLLPGWLPPSASREQGIGAVRAGKGDFFSRDVDFVSRGTLARLALSLAVGLVFGLVALYTTDASDFRYYWLAARAVIAGQSPYEVIGDGRSYGLVAGFLYPLTTAIATIPFAAWFTPVQGAATFIGVSSALLTWGITKEGYGRLAILASVPFFWARMSGQLSALVTASALIPSLGWLAAIKPNIGLAALAYNPSKRVLIATAFFVSASLAIDPTWPVQWLHAIGQRTPVNYQAPITIMGGPLLLLSLLRWKRPEARLLLVMAIVPQSLIFYDQLILWLIPKTFKESASLVIISSIGWLLGTYGATGVGQVPDEYGPVILMTIYLPCLAMVMRRPNEGALPAWLSAISSARTGRIPATDLSSG